MGCTTNPTTLTSTTTRLRRSSGLCQTAHDRESAIHAFDPFDFPDWLGTSQVSWHAATRLYDEPTVQGTLRSDEGDEIALDLLAADAAYPTVVCPQEHRLTAHQAWQFGQVAFVEVDGRVTATVPGIGFDANAACEVVRRLAKSVGASSDRFTVLIALGDDPLPDGSSLSP